MSSEKKFAAESGYPNAAPASREECYMLWLSAQHFLPWKTFVSMYTTNAFRRNVEEARKKTVANLLGFMTGPDEEVSTGCKLVVKVGRRGKFLTSSDRSSMCNNATLKQLHLDAPSCLRVEGSEQLQGWFLNDPMTVDHKRVTTALVFAQYRWVLR